MTISKVRHPKEYWAFKLGQQLADLRVRFEDAWNPFYPGDAFDPDSMGLQQKLPPVEFYDDLDLKVGEIRKTLKELTTRGPKVKKVALDALASLEGVVYKIEEDIDDQKLDDDPELKHTIQKLLASILKEKAGPLVDQSSVFLLPLIVDIMGEVYENHRRQEDIILGLLEDSPHESGEVPDTYATVSLGELPIFDRPKWKQFTERLSKTALSMGENSGVAFDVAKELELATYYFHIDTKIPYACWSTAQQCQYVGERTETAIAKLISAGFDAEAIRMRCKGVPPGTFAEYTAAAISERLKQGDAFCSPVETASDSSTGVLAHHTSLEWRDVRLTIVYEGTGQRILTVGPANDRELQEVSQTAVDWGFAKKRDPRLLTKQWCCLLLLAAGGAKAQFVKRDSGQIEVDFDLLSEAPEKLFRHLKSKLPNTKEAMKKQMKDLGQHLCTMTGIMGSPISLKRKAPENRLVWTIACSVELILQKPPNSDCDNS